jgi:hypothetical protein
LQGVGQRDPACLAEASPKTICNIGLGILYCIDNDAGMITRDIAGELQTLTSEYPVVTILGPRQAGKTTLAQMVLPDYA